ncbi:MAG TPA: asparaginase [Candidatus Dormibacteraeota bacterium]|nr:asparaginase [Candidatus Dormibacteraeota bacterium]
MPASAAPLVRVERNGIEEALHPGHVVVAGAGGHIEAFIGDPDRVTYFRSCAKPFQALASIRTGIVNRFGLRPEHIAIMAASHNGEPRHIDLVRELLQRCGVPESALQCGAHWPYYEPAAAVVRRQMDDPIPIFNNCSGKHAGMLAAALALGAPLETYLDRAHPVQQRIRDAVIEYTAVDPTSLRFGIDGCSAPNPAVPLAAMARSFARLTASDDDAVRSIIDAMTGQPFLVGGTDRFDTRLMEVTRGRLLAKGGAAGAHCTADRRSGLGLAIKLDSGDGTWVSVAVMAALEQLGWIDDAERAALAGFAEPELRNYRRTVVGSVRPLLRLR